jgi:hypothetical protein
MTNFKPLQVLRTARKTNNGIHSFEAGTRVRVVNFKEGVLTVRVQDSKLDASLQGQRIKVKPEAVVTTKVGRPKKQIAQV